MRCPVAPGKCQEGEIAQARTHRAHTQTQATVPREGVVVANELMRESLVMADKLPRRHIFGANAVAPLLLDPEPGASTKTQTRENVISAHKHYGLEVRHYGLPAKEPDYIARTIPGTRSCRARSSPTKRSSSRVRAPWLHPRRPDTPPP